MSRLASQSKIDIAIRELALSIVGHIPPKDFRGEIDRIFIWVRDRIRYTRDVAGVETVQTPAVTLEYAQGDCDDQVTLLAALLGSVGIDSRFVAVGFAPFQFQHVFLEAFDSNTGGWIALDPTEQVSIGWAPPDPVAVMYQGVP